MKNEDSDIKYNHFAVRDNVAVELRYDYATHLAPPLFQSNFSFNPAPYQGISPFEGVWSNANSDPLACSPCHNFGKKTQEPIQFKTQTPSAAFATLYPNPNTSGIFTITYMFEDATPVQINISDVMGKTQHTQTITYTKANMVLTTRVHLENQTLASGVYWVRISNAHTVLTQKLIIE